MRHLLAALLFPTKLLHARPTGRYLGSEPNTAEHSHTSDDFFVDTDLQKLWDTVPSSNPHSLPQMAVLDHAHVGQPGSSALAPFQHATGPAGGHQGAYSPPSHHHTGTPVASKSDSSSTHAGSSWSINDLHLLSPMRWDSPPLVAAPDRDHVGHSAPSILEPASKRLKKDGDAKLAPPHDRSKIPVGHELQGSNAHAGPSWMPSSNHLGPSEHVLASSATSSPTHAPQSSSKRLAIRKILLPAEEWKKAGLTMTEEAKPLDVQASLDRIRSKFTNSKEISLRSSVLKTAVASIAHGCTSKPQYIACMKDKYGEDLVKWHSKSLGRIINNDMMKKGTYPW